MKPLLEVQGLYSGYLGIPVLSGVDLDVQAGEFLGVFGHNGMGKTTLLRTIMGEVKTQRGSIQFDQRPIHGLPVARRAKMGLGYVPQGRRIYADLTVRENLKMAALAVRAASSMVDEVVDSLPRLRPILDRIGGVLSGGEQQILALGRCLVSNPRMILLDEPTEGIQPSIRDEIIDVLHGLRKQRELTIILVEQNLNFLEALVDRLVVLQKGVVRTDIQVSDLANLLAG
ncbi:ABC transporter ATP-binding protein [Pusillimonas sp.]|uniref:ABC transporter ATP-binding protein n=1 Tax=Pusillimonas sp. TaxID=3040095 RepID=UPI0037C65211